MGGGVEIRKKNSGVYQKDDITIVVKKMTQIVGSLGTTCSSSIS